MTDDFMGLAVRDIGKVRKIAIAAPPLGLNDFNDLVRMRDDETRLHGTIEAGLKVVRDIVETAKPA